MYKLYYIIRITFVSVYKVSLLQLSSVCLSGIIFLFNENINDTIK